GTDAVMLSAETSIGKYPLEAVRMMARAARAAEDALLETHRDRTFAAADRTFADALGAAAAVAAESIGARCILVFTASGYSAALIAQYRPRMPIHAFSGCAAVVAHLAVVWGVEARLLQPMPSGIEDLVHRCERALLESKQLAPGDPIAIVAGVPLEEQGNTNFLKLHRVGEGLGRGAAPAR
ncbi:MAG: pyruvate kinase, partial [Planctomycetes bacterium]|nr:pyruvate kinase [Planctomycetota bacterium]